MIALTCCFCCACLKEERWRSSSRTQSATCQGSLEISCRLPVQNRAPRRPTRHSHSTYVASWRIGTGAFPSRPRERAPSGRRRRRLYRRGGGRGPSEEGEEAVGTGDALVLSDAEK